MRTAVALLAIAACSNENDFNERTGSDTWLQAANNQVDILFVVDDSSSMQEEQATLAAGFSSFAAQLESSQTRFHLGVISTSFDYSDPQRGQLVGEPLYLTNEDDDYVQAFAERAQVGVSGSDQEKGLEAAAYALSPVANLDLNDGFVRRDARLLIVFVSDEEDCSDGGALGSALGEDCYTRREELVPVADFIQDVRGLKDDDADIQATAIVGLESSTCQNVFASARYAQFAQLTGGEVNDICDDDWSTMLGDLGLNASGVLSRFQLSSGAKPDSLEVYLDDTHVTEGWTYDPETWFITFDFDAIPPRGSVITANYIVAPGSARPPGL